jgi:hypothetical protein
VVTQIGWEGAMRRRALDTSALADAGRWEDLIEQVLASPPPYRADPGRPVYVIHAGDRAVLVGEQDLTGPLAHLVETILETGEPLLAAERAGSCRRGRDEPANAAPSQDAGQSRKTRGGVRAATTRSSRDPADADPCPHEHERRRLGDHTWRGAGADADPAFVPARGTASREFLEGCEAVLMGPQHVRALPFASGRWLWPDLNVFVLC